MKYYIKAFRHYADFEGRANRPEFWYFLLFDLIFNVLAVGADYLLGTTFKSDTGLCEFFGLCGYVSLLYSAGTFVPTIAVTARRFHDTGRSGWWQLVNLTIIGSIWVLAVCFTSSDEGENKYGPKP